MKKYGGILLAFLALTALLCACGSAPETEQSHTDHTETLMQDTTPDMVLPEDTLLSASESEQPQTQIADGKLRLLDYGTYSGLYPEDGSDEAVEQVLWSFRRCVGVRGKVSAAFRRRKREERRQEGVSLISDAM